MIVCSFQSLTGYSFITVPSCGGEEIEFSGTAHFVFHETISADGSSHQNSKMNYMKVTGVGLESGKRYHLHETNSAIVQHNQENDIIHSKITGTLIGQGKLTNVGVTINLLTQFDDDVDVKTSVEKIDLRCQGGKS